MAEYITGKEITEVYAEQLQYVQRSQKRKQAARDLLAGLIRAPLDESILPGDSFGREALRASSVQKYKLALDVLNKMIARQATAKRYPVGMGSRAMGAASKLEVSINAGMDQTFPHDAVLDLLLNESDALVITQLNTTHYDKNPHNSLTVSGPGSAIKAQYAVDSKGRAAEDPYYSGKRTFEADPSKSAEYFNGMRRDWNARSVPIVQRAFSGLTAIPINPRRDGQFMRLDGVVIKTTYTTSELLRRGYEWDRNSPLLQNPAPDGSSGGLSSQNTGASRNATLYELWYMGENGPYVSRSIDGLPTTKGGQDAIEDLGKDWGITELPLAFDYGLNFAGVMDHDYKGVPFPDIFARAWINIETLMTNVFVRAQREANTTCVIQLDPAVMEFLNVSDMPDAVELVPNAVNYVMGQPRDPWPSSTLTSLTDVYSMLIGDLGNNTPSEDAFGGGSSLSGRARNIAEDDVLGTMNQVTTGYLNIFGNSAAHWAEAAAAFGRKSQKGNVCLYVNQDIPVEQRTDTQSSTRMILEISPDDFGGVYEFTAEIPRNPADNIPLTQQLALLRKDGLVSKQYVQEEGLGLASPDTMNDQIAVERAEETPLGDALLMMDAAKVVGDRRQAKMMEQMAAGQLQMINQQLGVTPENVVPTGFNAGMQGPQRPDIMASGGGLPGMGGGGNIPGSMLAGTVAPAMSSSEIPEAVVSNG